MATGAALALAGPASAAPSHSASKSCFINPSCSNNNSFNSWSSLQQQLQQQSETDQLGIANSGNTFNGLINVDALNGGVSQHSSTGLFGGLGL
jgi:hypothetical protein